MTINNLILYIIICTVYNMHAHPLATKKRSLMIKAPMLLTSPRNAWESLGLKAAHIGAVALGVVSGSSGRTLKDQDSRDRLVLDALRKPPNV